ncbi:MAG: hypothetical protein LBJ43_04480 [Propionibacteriaceae bacterium]|nr:hypothetical protein [Propionibacteriaceae bacterium]
MLRVCLFSVAAIIPIGCSAQEVPAGSTNTPAFSGSWAADYQALFYRTESALVKEILFDGQITVTEYLTLGDELVDCLASQGAADGKVSTTGSVSFQSPPNGADPDSILSLCAGIMDWDSVTTLWRASRSNPNRDDWNTLMAECIVRMEQRPQGYTGLDYQHDRELGVWEEWPPPLSAVVENTCLSDPRTELSVYQIQADCLVRVGLRELGYTAPQFRAEFEANALPSPNPANPDSGFRLVAICFDDPFYAVR